MKYSFKDIEVGEFFKDEDGVVHQKYSEYEAVDEDGTGWHCFNLNTPQYSIIDPEYFV